MVMETKKHYIAYMDILGYSDYIEKNPDKTNDFLQTVAEAIDKIKKNVCYISTIGKNGFKADIEIKCKTFSDNILLCMEVSNDSNEISRIIPFLISAATIQKGLTIEHELLVRGGVTIGDLYIDNDLVFGKGLIDAVRLEHQAENPCIIVSQELQNHIEKLIDVNDDGYKIIKRYVDAIANKSKPSKKDEQYYLKNGEKYFKGVFYYQSVRELIIHYEQETPFLNYLFEMSDRRLFGNDFTDFMISEREKNKGKFADIVVCTDNISQILFAHREVIAKRINTYCNYEDIEKTDKKQVAEREKVIRKHIWVLRYHNSICQRYGLNFLVLPHKYGCDMNNLRTVVKVDI